MLLALLAATLITDYYGDPPTYLTGLLGTAAGAFFTALGSDKSKRDTDRQVAADRTEATANRAEDKADTLGRVTSREHPEVRDELTPPFEPEKLDGGDTT